MPLKQPGWFDTYTCEVQPLCPVGEYLNGSSTTSNGTCTACDNAVCGLGQVQEGTCAGEVNGFTCKDRGFAGIGGAGADFTNYTEGNGGQTNTGTNGNINGDGGGDGDDDTGDGGDESSGGGATSTTGAPGEEEASSVDDQDTGDGGGGDGVWIACVAVLLVLAVAVAVGIILRKWCQRGATQVRHPGRTYSAL